MTASGPDLSTLVTEAARSAPGAAEHLADKGIVTLADENYFPGLMLLHRSVQESWPLPVACFDLGLSEQQRAIASAVDNLSILPLPETPLIDEIRTQMAKAPKLAKAHKRVWPLWICPALISAAPFRRVFWMDCDVAILRNLPGLFALLDDGPVFTPENNAPDATPNNPALYEYLAIDRHFDPRIPAVNAGISGWDLERDRSVLAAYLYPVREAISDERVRDAISWHDQGALIWAIQRCGLEHRVVETTAWNLCVRNSPVMQLQIPWGEEFLHRIRSSEPAANILHWNGAKMPWLG